MAYLSEKELSTLKFKFIGSNVKISDKASLYNTENMSIGDNSRIDDFCILSGDIDIGSYVHITPMCLIAGGEPGVIISDFCTLAYGVKVFAQSDDYSGNTMVSSLVDKKYKSEIFSKVVLEKHVIAGTNSVILPGTIVAEGCSLGAMTLLNKSTTPWGIYVGSPAIRIKNRNQNILKLEKEFLKER